MGCDCEPVQTRSRVVWRDLLGAGGFSMAELIAPRPRMILPRPQPVSGCALECDKEAGVRQDLGIVLRTVDGQEVPNDNWVMLGPGASRFATVVHAPGRLQFADALLRIPPRSGIRGDQPGGQCLLREPSALAGPLPGDVSSRACPVGAGRARNGLVLATTRCSCDYLEEVSGFEEVAIRMKLLSMTQSRLILEFEYWRGETLVARKRATVASMRRENGTMIPVPLPAELREALEGYR